MPFKSKAQVAKFAEMVRSGDMKKEVFEEWMRATTNPRGLPQRLAKAIKIPKVKVIK